MRSADGAGADAVIAASPRTDLFNPNAIRASAGTMFTVPTGAAPTAEVIAWLRERGLRIVAARVGAGSAYTEADLTGPLALVLGAEADGLTDAWVADGIEAVNLPMLGVADSLNVSISAAILLYEARRQRGVPLPIGRSDRGHARFRDHRRGTGRRGRRAQGPGARGHGRRSSIAAGSAAVARTSAACRRSRCSRTRHGTMPTRPPSSGRAPRPTATSWSTARPTHPSRTTPATSRH